MIFEIERPQKAAPLFEGWQQTMIWSCLQGIMGHLYADSREEFTCAMAMLGDFCFLAGSPKTELVSYKPEWCSQDFMIMVPQNAGWAEAIERCYGKRAKRIVRHAMKKESRSFDETALQRAVDALPEGYELSMIDEKLFERCRSMDWCRDWVSQHSSYEQYQKHGLGVVVQKNGELVSGASSYSGYLGGIEIEIDTKQEYRRKGLAYVCGAKLILECLKRGWHPSWDAHNLWSAALAKKLGYQYDHAYDAYEIWGY